MAFECERCGYTTERKLNLKRHLLRQNTCPITCKSVSVATLLEKLNVSPSVAPNEPLLSTSVEPSVSNAAEAPRYVCKDCGAVFKTRKTKHKHIKFNRCRLAAPDLATEVKEIKQHNQDLEEKLAKQEKQIEKLEKSKKSKTVNNYISNHINNYTMNSFGREYKTHTISPETYARICSKPYTAVCGLIREKHFNSEHPENQNVIATNAKATTCHVVENGAYVLRNKTDVASEMCFKNYDELQTAFRDGVRELLEPFKRRCWIEFEDAWDSQPEVSRQIVERIKLICYNEPRRE